MRFESLQLQKTEEAYIAKIKVGVAGCGTIGQRLADGVADPGDYHRGLTNALQMEKLLPIRRWI